MCIRDRLYFALLMKRDWPALDVTVFERNQPDDTFGFGVVFSDQTLDTFRAADAQSYAAIRDNFAYWDDIEIHFKRDTFRVPGNGFCGCSRRSLLMLVQARARELGAVPYTHLDVYKRQLLHRLAGRCPPCRGRHQQDGSRRL